MNNDFYKFWQVRKVSTQSQSEKKTQMISALRKSTSLVRPRVLSSFATNEWTRSFQTTPKVEAESMGNLIDKGKEGAEFVVSGTFNILYPLSLLQFQTESQ